jgi:hypothetical protein
MAGSEASYLLLCRLRSRFRVLSLILHYCSANRCRPPRWWWKNLDVKPAESYLAKEKGDELLHLGKHHESLERLLLTSHH